MSALTAAEVASLIDTLDRSEPHAPQMHWRAAYDTLETALRGTRRVRRYLAIPAAIFAAILVVVFHGEAWNFDEIRNLFVIEGLTLIALHFALSKIYAVLAREGRIAALLTYFGARDLPEEEPLTP